MLYPLAIDLKNKTVLIIGGGHITTRKIKRLLNYACTVVIISPHITEELNELLHDTDKQSLCKLHWEKQWYQFELLEAVQPHLVFACTNDETVNQRIIEHCRRMGILSSSATHGHYAGDCITPNCFELADKKIQVATWTTENLPLLSKHVSESLKTYLLKQEGGLKQVIETLSVLKRHLKKTEPEQDKRAHILKTIFEHPDFMLNLQNPIYQEDPILLINQALAQPSNKPVS